MVPEPRWIINGRRSGVCFRIANPEEGQLLLQDGQRRLQPERSQQRSHPGAGREDHSVGRIGALRRAHPHPVAVRFDRQHRFFFPQLSPGGASLCR